VIKSVNDLWIGDKLMLLKSKRVGVFMGINAAGKLKLKIQNKTVLTTLKNVSLFEDNKHEEEVLFFEDEEPQVTPFKISESVKQIDLHMEVLAPHMLQQPAARILDYQIKSFHDFLHQAYGKRLGLVTIIHGKGEGVLKAEIQYYLQKDERVRFITETNNGGATEVWFQY
jgi:hypothetical protein